MRAIPVTNHLLREGFRNNATDMTPLKVQKMLFFLHGWYAAVTGQPLIDEGFEKWPYGPVSPPVYEELKHHGARPVDSYIEEWDEGRNEFTAFFVNTAALPQFKEILEKVWQEYGPLTGAQLSTLTHLPNTPWARTDGRQRIDDAIIRDFFRNEAAIKKSRSFGGTANA